MTAPILLKPFVTAALGVHFQIEGLATLKVKETDRLVALKNELLKIGLETEITEDSIKSARFSKWKKSLVLKPTTTIVWR